jgi:hypothetical protein
LTGVDFSASTDLKAIGSNAFRDCKLLATVAWPPNLETIELGAFNGCGFQTLVLPATLKRVDSNAFSNCADLLWIKWPAAPPGAYIAGSNIFTNCESLARAELPAGLSGINHFSGCSNLAIIIARMDTAPLPGYTTSYNADTNDTYIVYVPAATISSWYEHPASSWGINFDPERIVSIDELEDTPDKWE